MHASLKKMNSRTTVVLVLGTILMLPAAQGRDVTLDQWLEDQPKPAYKAGHSLPRLTRYAYSLPVAARIKLCEDWGYALEYGRENGTYVGGDNGVRLDDPTTPEAQVAALAKSDPLRYPLVVVCDRRMPTEAESPDAFVRDANGKIFYNSFTQADGTVVQLGPVYSPGAPASSWEMAGEFRAAPFRDMVARGIPISMVLNGGEYSGFPGTVDDAQSIYQQDAGIAAQVASSPWGGGNWRNYHSAKRAAMEKIIATAVRNAIPNLKSYTHYVSGGRPERNRYAYIDGYGGYWEHCRGVNVAPGGVDIPSDQAYHGSQNAGFTGGAAGGHRDMLTQALNAKAICIATGNPLSYDWVSAGWDGNTADVNRWTGFLKCFYTAGTIGTNTGAYGSPPMGGTFIGHIFPVNSPPEYAKNLAASAYVHALFSQVDTFIRNSDLLPGPMSHVMSPQEPAYEFPTGEDNARVLARKDRTEETWLITAWAAGGEDRNVSVYIPELGQLTVEARIVGSVYKATLAGGNVTLIRLDNEGARYTAVADGTPVVTPMNLAYPAPIAQDRLFWASADSGVTADGSGKVSAWASQGDGLTVTQADASKQPTLVPNAIGGKPVLRFVNGQTWLQNANTGTAGDAFVGGVNVIAVVTDSAVNGGKRVASGTTAGGSEWLGGQGFCLYGDANNNVTLSNGVAIKLSHGSFDSRLNSLVIGDSAAAGPGYTFGFTGDIAEIIIYKAMSPARQTQIFDYLRAKYSISQTRDIANGSFEAPPAYGFRYNPGAEIQEKVGWVFANGAVIQQNGSPLGAAAAPDGVQTAVLQGINKELGCLAQTLSLDAGTYTIRFKAARHSKGDVQPLKFSIDGVQIGEFITPASSAFAEYKTSQFTAKAGQHVLRIEATNGDGEKSTFIDQIELVKDPVPTTR